MNNDVLQILFVLNDHEDVNALADAVEEHDLDYQLRITGTLSGARALVEDEDFDVVIIDYDVGREDTLDVIHDIPIQTAVILLSNIGDEKVAVEALKRGFTDYVVKDEARNYLVTLPMTISGAVRSKNLEVALHEYHEDLERKVRQRTQELDAVNRRLRDEIREKEALLRRLRGSESRYRAIFETTGSATIIFGRDWEIELANFEAALLFGMSDPTALRGLRWIELLADRARDRLLEIRDQLEGRQHREETRVFGRDGKIRRVILTVRAVPGSDSFVASLTDITARRDAEEQRLRFETMMLATPDLVSYFDPDFKVQYINPAGRRLIGLGPHAPVSKLKASDLHPKDEWRRLQREILPRVEDEGSWTGESLLRSRGEEEPLPVQQVLMAHPDASGEVAFYSTFMRDLRERKELEAQLLHSQKQEAIGRMAGGIAHDFNNVLTAILSSAELLSLSSSLSASDQEAIDEIRQASMRASSMTRQLLALAKKQFTRPRVLQVNELIRDVTNLLERLLPAGIRLNLQLHPRPWNVFIDPGQLEQVLMNLAINARDAMPEGGSLFIETSHVIVDANYCKTHPSLRPGEFLCLSVRDTGEGMPMDVQERVFEPFFTTKKRGEGTGLGLATTLGIVRQAGGDIDVTSTEGRGSLFRVLLPRCRKERDEKKVGEKALQRGDGERVLIVEDDEVVRRIASVTLRRCGYEVAACANARDAVEYIKEVNPDEAPVVALIDVVLPDVGGPKLMRKLREFQPDLQVILTSGYTEQTITPEDLQFSGHEMLEKPFSPESLSSAIHSALQAQ
jgi:PAS domain S-box-containing protein